MGQAGYCCSNSPAGLAGCPPGLGLDFLLYLASKAIGKGKAVLDSGVLPLCQVGRMGLTRQDRDHRRLRIVSAALVEAKRSGAWLLAEGRPEDWSAGPVGGRRSLYPSGRE